MRGALFLAAWASVLAVTEPALDPLLQALYGPRQPQRKDVRLLQAKFADDDYADSQAYDYGGADYGHVPPSRLLGRIFQSAGLDDYENERTTLYCITVKPKPSTTPSTTLSTAPSTTPAVICFPPSHATKTTRPTTTTSAPIGKCDNANPPSKVTTSTTAAAKLQYSLHRSSAHEHTTKKHTTGHHDGTRHSSSTRHSSPPRPSSAKTSECKNHVCTEEATSRSTSKGTTTSHRTHTTMHSSHTTHTTRKPTHSSTRSTPVYNHEHAPKHIATVGNCGAAVLMTTLLSTSKKSTASKTVTTHTSAKRKTTTTHKPKTTQKRTTVRVTTHATRTTHKTSAKPKLDAKGCPAGPQPEPKTTSPTSTTPKTRPPVDEFLAAWGSFRHHNSLDPRNGSHWREFHNADGGHTQRRRDLRDGVVIIVPPWVRGKPPGDHEQAFLAPPAGMRLYKRDEGQPESAAPYRRFWYRNWPPAGGEVSRMPARDKENFVKLASWWQDVLRTYNGHQRKKRSQARR